jgi:hypothetical protein
VSKPYPKYEYQPEKSGPKKAEKESFLKAINGSNSDHLYGLNPLGKKNHCFFCPKKSTLRAQKQGDSKEFPLFQEKKLNPSDLMEIPKKKEPKREQFRGKLTKWWCQKCKKFICKDCWSKFH